MPVPVVRPGVEVEMVGDEMRFQPGCPLSGLPDQIGPVTSVEPWCAGVIVGHARPQVAPVAADVHAQAPRGQIEGIATSGSHVTRRDAVAGQLTQIGRVELHGAHIVRAIDVALPLSWTAAFLLGHGQHDVGWHLVAGSGGQRAGDALLHLRGKPGGKGWLHGCVLLNVPTAQEPLPLFCFWIACATCPPTVLSMRAFAAAFIP